MNNLVIRKMEKYDYEKIKKIDEKTQEQYLGDKWKKLSRSEKESHLVSRLDEFKFNLNTGYCLVALCDSIICGFLFAHETIPLKGTVFVRYIAVDPVKQKEGIGPALYSALKDIARRNGIKRIEALINTDNSISIKMHESCGFTLTDRKEAIFIL